MDFAYKEFDPFHVFWVVLEVRKCLGSDNSRKPGILKMNRNSSERSARNYAAALTPQPKELQVCVLCQPFPNGDLKEWEGMWEVVRKKAHPPSGQAHAIYNRKRGRSESSPALLFHGKIEGIWWLKSVCPLVSSGRISLATEETIYVAEVVVHVNPLCWRWKRLSRQVLP